jgi:DnaJ-class molecular chaperone
MKRKRPATEVRCDACNGTGKVPVVEPEPGRRIYPGRCAKCGGKGRIARKP